MSANIVINQYYFEYLASVLIVIGYYVYPLAELKS
jgi:hypothetical protein